MTTSALTNRVAVVTGAAGGLGKEICGGFAEQGADVVLIDVDSERLETAAMLVRDAGRAALVVEADASDERAVQRAFEQVDLAFERLDILVNLAYTPVFEDPIELTLNQWQLALKVNLTSYFLCCRAAGKRMIQSRRGGTIVNMASIGASSALGHGSFAYSVSKGGVIMLTRELAIEWARYRIRVNAIQPCQFMTPSLRRRLADLDSEVARKRLIAGIPLGRFGEPEEMVGPVLFLASEASSMVTGAVLPVDGGNLALNAGSAAF